MQTRDFFASASREAEQQQRIARLIEMAGWKDDPRILAQLRLALRTGNWEPILKMLRMRFSQAKEFHPFQNVPSASDVNGEIIIGNVLLPDFTLGPRVGLDPGQITRHGVIAGPPGKGKTTTGKWIGIQWHRLGGRCIIPDADRQFTDFPVFVAPGEAAVLDVAKGEFKRAIWQPLPGGTFEENESRLRAVFNEVWVGPGGGNILSDLALEMNAEGGPFTMSQIFERLKRLRSRTRDFRRLGYLESAISAMSNLVNHLRQGYDVLEGFPLDQLLNFSLVLNVCDLAADSAVFVNTELASAVAKHTLREPSERPLLILWDEAQRLLKAAGHAATVEGEPVLFEFFRGARKRATGIWVMTHLASEIPAAVSGNVATHIYYQTSDGGSIEAIARAHSLTPEQKRFIPEIPGRCAVMKHPNFPKPFLVRMAELNLEHSATAEQIAKIMAPVLASLKWKPSPCAGDIAAGRSTDRPSREPEIESDIASHDADNMEHSEVTEEPPIEKAKPNNALGGLAKHEVDYLEAIAWQPFISSTQRDKDNGISISVGSARRKKLIERGIIELHKIQVVPHGGASTLVEITDKGWDLLKEIKSKVKPPPGRGSFIHKWGQDRVASHIRESLPDAVVTIEDGDDKAVDVLVRNGSETIGVEISVSTRPEDELRNLAGDLNFCDRIFLLAETEAHLAGIKSLLESELSAPDRERVSFGLLNQFVNSPFPPQASLP